MEAHNTNKYIQCKQRHQSTHTQGHFTHDYKHTSTKSNCDKTNTLRVLQGVIIGGGLLIIFQMRISENLNKRGEQGDRATLQHQRVTK